MLPQQFSIPIPSKMTAEEKNYLIYLKALAAALVSPFLPVFWFFFGAFLGRFFFDKMKYLNDEEKKTKKSRLGDFKYLPLPVCVCICIRACVSISQMFKSASALVFVSGSGLPAALCCLPLYFLFFDFLEFFHFQCLSFEAREITL